MGSVFYDIEQKSGALKGAFLHTILSEVYYFAHEVVMIEWFSSLAHYQQALLATLFTWGVTVLGASVVIFFRAVHKDVMDATLGFSSGVMIAASFWSLLLPANEMAHELGFSSDAVLIMGFFCGGVLLFAGDRIFDFVKAKMPEDSDDIDKKRASLLVFSITLHNIPEGLCVGVAFGSLAYGAKGATLVSACVLALGIGIQNFPEGAAVSVPLRREGFSRSRAFFWGQISGAVEPIAGVCGALLVTHVKTMLPFCLSFAAGAMIYVVSKELIPESQSGEKKDVMALFTLVGFAVMMLLDVTFS